MNIWAEQDEYAEDSKEDAKQNQNNTRDIDETPRQWERQNHLCNDSYKSISSLNCCIFVNSLCSKEMLKSFLWPSLWNSLSAVRHALQQLHIIWSCNRPSALIAEF